MSGHAIEKVCEGRKKEGGRRKEGAMRAGRR
jgi:hypothetical protein